MSKVDEELTRRFRRAERPVGGDELFEGLTRRRRRRRALQRLEAGALAIAVLAGTSGGFVALRAVFDERGESAGEPLGPAENGRIVFSLDVEQKGRSTTHLFSMEPDISAPMQLTEGDSANYSPAVSPDGRTIAFTHELFDAQHDVQEVVIGSMTIDGSPPTWLTDPELEASNPTWSPDGARVAFTGRNGDTQRIFVMNADGSDVHPITGDGVSTPDDPAWSPDGSQIAFRGSPSPERSAWDIFTIEPDGARLTNATNSAALEYEPSWSPDGELIAYTSHGLDQPPDIIVRRLSDGSETFLTQGPEHDSAPAWSPDGLYVVFDRWIDNGQPHLWRVRADGSELTRLTREAAYGAAWQPVPVGSQPSMAPSPEPTSPPSPEPEGRDIGLGFNLCDARRLGGIDFLGAGHGGAAWVGFPTRDDGTCPRFGLPGKYAIAADHTGDGIADSWMDLPWKCYVGCSPFDATDLDGNGTEELIVASYFSIMDYYVMTVAPNASGRLQIQPILVAEPGHPPAGIDAGEPLRIDAGGDEGYGSQIECEGYPGAPVIVWSSSSGVVESNRPKEIHIVRIQLQADGLFHVIGASDYTIPADQPSGIESTSPACGVDWHPSA